MDKSEESSSSEVQKIGYHEIADRVADHLFKRDQGSIEKTFMYDVNYTNHMGDTNRELAKLASSGISQIDAFRMLFALDSSMNNTGFFYSHSGMVDAKLRNLTIFAFEDHPFLKHFPPELVNQQFAELISEQVAYDEKALREEKGMDQLREYRMKSELTSFKQILSQIRGESEEKNVENATKPIAESKGFKKRISGFFRRKK